MYDSHLYFVNILTIAAAKIAIKNIEKAIPKLEGRFDP